jgi:small subunit ribosomal protein S13
MDEKLKHIVRIVSTDLEGSKPIGQSFLKIKGVGHSMINAVCSIISLDRNRKTGSLSDDEVKKIENVIKNPIENGIPDWMVNRQKDRDTGDDLHLTTSDLRLRKEFDLKRLMKIKSRRGLRTSVGLPSRGQKTKSNFRKKKGRGGKSLGVKTKKKSKKG